MVGYVRVRQYTGPPKKITARGAPIKIRGKPEVEEEMNQWFEGLHNLVFKGVPKQNFRIGFQ